MSENDWTLDFGNARRFGEIACPVCGQSLRYLKSGEIAGVFCESCHARLKVITATNTPIVPKPRKQDDLSTHSGLCLAVARWCVNRRAPLYRKRAVVEFVSASIEESPDVFAFDKYGSILYEIKMSLADFRADKKKRFRQESQDGLGERRYFVCPSGLIPEEKLPPHWGLIYVSRDAFKIIKQAEPVTACKIAEMSIIDSILDRENIGHGVLLYRKNAVTAEK